MHLTFPELRGGPVQGLNDAGVETFLGAIDLHVSRECGQNTGDAHAAYVDTVRLEFDRFTMPTTAVPGFDQLRTTLQSCLDRWGAKEKEKEFFEQAIALAGEKEISVLKISDYGTTGLTGTDDDELGRWFALVKSQGVSNKDDTAGGAFGIGKSSPFAASRFRTVFYGSRTEAGALAFQGVSRLATHKNPDSRNTQGVGFIGTYDATGGEGGEPLFRAIRDEALIPTFFRRAEPGTDIWIIGYRSGTEWKSDLIRSILTNFWPAVFRGSIQFRVGEQTVSRETLAELVRRYIGHEEFDAHHFYPAILNQPIRKRLTHVGECELYLSTASADLPRKICMARTSGMRIYDYQPRACRVPFSGLFICTDVEGNRLLRKLEPPKHDTWDPKRIEDSTGKSALVAIKSWIREEVKKLNPLYAGSSFNESELAKYLPDAEPDDLNDLPNDETGQSDEESLEPKPKSGDSPITTVKAKPLTPSGGGSAEGGFGNDGELGGGQHGAGASGTGNRSRGGGDSAPPKLRVRTFLSGSDLYDLILRSDGSFSGDVRIHAVGEDGHYEPVCLTGALVGDAPGIQLPVHGDAIVGVQLTGGTPLRISLTLDETERRSLTASLSA